MAPYHILAPWERGWALLRKRSHRTLSPGCQVPDLPFILGVFTRSQDTSPCLTHCSSSLPWVIHVGLSPSLISSTQESHSQRLTFSHVLVPLCIQQHLQWASIRRQVLLQLFGINTSTQHKFLPSPNSQARRGRQTISIINKLYCLSEGTKQPPKNPRVWEVEGRLSRSTGGRGVAITNRIVRWASHGEGDA